MIFKALQVGRFWYDFIPQAQQGHGDWKTLPVRAQQITAAGPQVYNV